MSRTTESAPAVPSAPQTDLSAVATNPTTVPDLAERLLTLAAEDELLTHEALKLPAAAHRRETVAQCRTDHARVLREAVETSGWPSCSAVGERASLAALRILLHSSDLELMLSCREQIATAVEDKTSPPLHLAYIDGACAVLQDRR